MDRKMKLAIMTNGGMGNLFLQANFIYCLHEYLVEEPLHWAVFGHRSHELNQAVLRHMDFLDEWHDYGDRGMALSYDVCVNLNFYPEVMTLSPEVEYFCPKLFRLLREWENFLGDASRRYCASHPDDDFNVYVLGILRGKNCLSVGDVTGALGIPEDGYRLPLRAEDREAREYLSSLGLFDNEYITVHRGVSALLEKESSPKLWPVAHYEELIRMLKQCFPEKKILQLGETDACDELEGVDRSLLGRTSWEDLKILLGYAWLHIDTEGGLVHLRKALKGGPSAVLFGPTPREFYGYKENLNITSGKCLHWCARLTDAWATRCPREGGTPICMTELSPSLVMKEIMRWNYLEKMKVGRWKGALGSFPSDDLLERLDREYREEFLWQHQVYYAEMRQLPLAGLQGIVMTEQGFRWMPLRETPAYRFLRGDKESYRSYLTRLRKNYGDEIHSEKRYLSLVQSLAEKGYDSEKCSIAIDADGRILDGQHRAAWLLTHGKKEKAEVLVIHSFYDRERLFPFHKVQKGSRVAIYGMGSLGMSYLRQLEDTSFAHPTLKLDRRSDATKGIYPPEYIRTHGEAFDVIVLAAANRRHLDEMASCLRELGVSQKCIIA